MNKKKTIIIVVVLIAAIAIWYFVIRKKPTASTTQSIAVGDQPQSTGSPTEVPTGVQALPAATQPSQTLDVSQATTSTGQPSNTDKSVVSNWFNTLGAANKQQAFAMLPSMTPQELSNMAIILTQYWPTGTPVTPALRTFWDTWRVKYHILDGTYNP